MAAPPPSPAAPTIGDDALFFHNPPSDHGLLRALFVGRERELELLHRRLPGTMPGTVRAIHGESRVGKSHLALRFLSDLQNLHLVIVPAASGKRAWIILRDIYAALRTRIGEAWTRAQASPESLAHIDPGTGTHTRGGSEGEGVSTYQDLAAAIDLIEQMDDLIEGRAQSRERQSAEGDESSADFAVKPSGIGLGGAAKHTRSLGDKRVLIRPDEDGLCAVIAQLGQALHLATGQRVLIYVDDVDLLDVGPGADPEQVVLLNRALYRLSKNPELTVVASLRTRHMRDRDKEFSDVVQVRRLKDSELRQIYARQLEHFGVAQPIMDDDCLDRLIQHAGGKVGVFLRLCFQLRDFGLLERPGQVLRSADLEEFLMAEIRHELLSTPDYRPHVQSIVAALKANTLEVELPPEVQNTPIPHLLLDDPPTPLSPRRYTIKRLTAQALRRLYPSELPPPAALPGSPS